MIRGKGVSPTKALSGVALACALMLAIPAIAYAEVPHVATGTTPDTCAMCHRAHTAPGDFGRVDAESWEMTSSALGLAVPSAAGDTALCYVCHGVDALGSGTPVGASFEETSVHTLAPVASPFGPSVKYCSSCHDAHGTDKVTTDTPYPSLLRSRTEAGDLVFQDSAYCGTCHTVREDSRFDGVEIYEQTVHYSMLPDPANGTKIRCTICHVGHGSAIAPLIVSQITPPSVTATATITANDRTLCLTCHEDVRGTYSGETSYTLSAHAASSVLTTIPGEWPAEDAERLVGECQVCHAPMGRDDGSGAPIPTLLEVEGSALCLTCHEVDGPAATDLASLQYPAAAAADLELVAAFSPETTTSAFGTVAVWGTEATATVPRTIVGPRLYEPADLTGAMAVGDIDGQEGADVVVADPDAAQITVFIQDPLKGLTSYFGPGTVALASIDGSLAGVTAEYVTVADVLTDLDDLPEVILVDADSSTLYALRWDILAAEFTLVDTVTGLGADITGLAVGNLDADPLIEIVVTDADAPEIHVIDGSSGSLVVTTTFTAKAGVRGPSIGDADAAGGQEIVVANADEATDHLTVYNAAGAELDSYAVDAAAGARAWATLVHEVLPDATPGRAQVSVAVNGGADLMSSINVFTQLPGSGLDTPLRYDTGLGYSTGSLAGGDIDGDGRDELVVGNGGFWSRDPIDAMAPSVQVFQHNGTLDAFAPASTQTLRAGGVERAGAAPALVIADLGGVGPSRHPAGAVADTHVSTETAPFVRHVECADCHNAHEATSTVAAAPAAYGRILGTFGATAAHAPAEPIAREYELCYACHSAYQDAAGLEGSADISADFAVTNASVHAVEQSVATTINAGTFVGDWDNDSVLYCIDCHAVAGSTPAVAGPHASSEAPILKSPYLGTVPFQDAMLCYDCHKYEVYYEASQDTTSATGSFFWDADAGALHALHVRDGGFGCASCHASHGSPDNEALVRDAIDFERVGAGGTCIGPCPLTPGVVYER